MRFSGEQKNFSDALQILVNLYNNAGRVDEGSFFSEARIKLFAELFHKSIPNFSPCIFFEGKYAFFFMYRKAMESIRFIDENEQWPEKSVGQFLSIMGALREDIKNNNYELFNITEVIYETRLYSEIKNSEVYGLLNSVGLMKKGHQYYNKFNYDKKFMDYCKNPYITKKVDCEIRPMMQVRLLSDHGAAWSLNHFITHTNLNAPPPYHETFKVSYLNDSSFYKALGVEDIEENISSPGYLDSRPYFIDVIKYILVKYVALFGSFGRIKICKNCGQLFFEKKQGHGLFCNDRCRITFNVEAEPQATRRCRARQNAWMERMLYRPFTRQKSDCANCGMNDKDRVKGGMCQTLLEKNKGKMQKQKKLRSKGLSTSR